MDALAFLNKSTPAPRRPVYLLTGDEDFLKRRVLERVQTLVLEGADPAFALGVFAGDKAEFTAVRNELDTVPFLAARRLVIVEQADAFVTRYRVTLEKYLSAPSGSGVLVLNVRSEKANTKLARGLPDDAFVVCAAPAASRLPPWCVEWAMSAHGKKLSRPAAELLVELIGPHMGQLDQEIGKLAVYVGQKATIDGGDVDALVGRSRAANVFRILGAVGEGRPAEALTILGELYEGGEDPVGVLGALGYQVRKLATAGRLITQGVLTDDAMDRAGLAKWPQAREDAKKQLQHLGRRRLDKLFDWLIEADLGMKGSSPLPPKLVLERLLVRLARPRPA